MRKLTSIFLVLVGLGFSQTPGEVSVDDVFVEEITILATQYQALESTQLENGKEYYLKVTGSYSYGSQNCMDAAYHYCTWNNPVDPSPGRVWTWNGSGSQRPYPDVYNSDHVYYFYFTSDGTTEEFGFEDGGGYGDNSGSVTVEIWKRVETPTNYSLSFDGVDDYVDLGNSDNLITGTNVTYSCWFKLTDTDAAYLISNQKSSGSSNLSLGVNRNGITETAGYITVVIWNGTSWDRVNYDGSVDDSAWHHIAFTTTSSAQVLYLDGSQVATGSNIYSQSVSSDIASIGSLNGEDWFIGGFINEVAIWNTVLTQQEIQSYMSTPPIGDESGLVGYWNFNEGEGDTLTDQTANGNDGTIYGATWSAEVSTGLYPFDVVDPTGLPYHVIVSGLIVNGENPS
jgi:hypothetical protein